MATGWGNKTWGASEWGDLSDELVVTSSVAAQTSVNSVITKADANVFPTTLSATVTLQGATAGASALVLPQGIGLNITTEDVSIGIGVSVTGVSASTDITGVTIDDQYLIGSGWGRETWGSFVWGDNYSVQLNGISLSVIIGDEDAFTDVLVVVTTAGSLQTAVNSVGTSANSDHEIAASLLINSVTGDVDIEGNGLVELTGVSTSIAIGDAEAGLLTEVQVTGVSLTTFIGDEDITGNASVTLTEVTGTVAPGQLTYIASYDVTGSSSSMAKWRNYYYWIRSCNAPTGVGLTVSTISPNIIAWAEVDTGTPVTWTPVDLAA
jgi:hypothetical protein